MSGRRPINSKLGSFSVLEKPRKQLVQIEAFIPVYGEEMISLAILKRAFPLRLKTDMKSFLATSSVRMNCPFTLKYAYLPDGTLLTDFSMLEDHIETIFLSRYPNLVKR